MPEPPLRDDLTGIVRGVLPPAHALILTEPVMPLPILAAVALATAQQTAAPQIYDGRADRIAVQTPRLEATITVDGVLDEPVWAAAAVLTGFSQYRPVDGLPAADSTEVFVWYDDDAIHIGVRAFEPHGILNATLADRDRIGGDDHIQVFLDTFHDRRRALVFAFNPLGVQADGIWTEGTASTTATSDVDRFLDLSPDFTFQSRGRRTPTGYEVEVRIPFASIRYQSAQVQTWGINIVRRVQHSGQQQTWTRALQGQASFLAQSGTLDELRGLDRGLVLDVNPIVTARADGAYDANQDWRYDAGRPEFGANARWGIAENVTLNATVNPDFSHVESDAGQLTFDPRLALFFPEKRRFFLEASENFAAPNRLIYTRRIAAPVAAAKFTAKLSDTEIGVISAVDDRAFSYSQDDNPVFNLLRVRHDIGANSTAGFVYTDRIDGSNYNRVAAADTRLIFRNEYTVNLQAGASFTRSPTLDEQARPIFLVSGSRRGRAFNASASLFGAHDGFRTLSGFIGRSGIVSALIQPSYTVFGREGSLLDSWTGAISLDGTWTYDRFMNGQSADDRKLHFNSNFLLRGGWRLGTGLFLESFRYPAELYANYFIDLGTDTVPFTGTDRISNQALVLNVSTPQFPKFFADLFIATGRDENFEEWAPAWILFSTLITEWRPTEQMRIEATWDHQRFHREDDRSLVLVRHIPRLKLEYQVSRPLFIRLVGQYDAIKRDALRDASRTEAPILIRVAENTFVPAAAYQQSGFSVDWLFSYEPTPGTVIFAGYGSTLLDDGGYGFRRLRRSSDGFFVKLSYLLRL